MRTARGANGGLERYILGVALLVPLAVGVIALTQLPGVNLGMPSTLVYADSSAAALVHKSPAASQPAPPATLAPPPPTPTPMPRPSATPVPAVATPRTYTVQKGDELKSIAANFKVSIWKIIDANDIPDPDSLHIGQELRIPEN